MTEDEIARLKWRCRRGLLELDVLLQAFVDRRYARLGAVERATFIRLLDLSDTRLLAMLYGQETPGDAELAHLVAQIRA